MALSDLSSCPGGRRSLQFNVTVTRASESGDVVSGSAELAPCRPRRVAVADLSSDDCQLNGDDDADYCPWQIRPDSHINQPSSHQSGSVAEICY